MGERPAAKAAEKSCCRWGGWDAVTAKGMLHSRAQRTRWLKPPKNRVVTGGAMTYFRPKADSIIAVVGAGTKSPAAKAAGKSCCRWEGWYVLYIRTPPMRLPACMLGSGASLEAAHAWNRAQLGAVPWLESRKRVGAQTDFETHRRTRRAQAPPGPPSSPSQQNNRTRRASAPGPPKWGNTLMTYDLWIHKS